MLEKLSPPVVPTTLLTPAEENKRPGLSTSDLGAGSKIGTDSSVVSTSTLTRTHVQPGERMAIEHSALASDRIGGSKVLVGKEENQLFGLKSAVTRLSPSPTSGGLAASR